MKRIYLDYAAATPLDLRVLRAMIPFFRKQYGNPSSIHASGRAARAAIEEARKKIADILHTQPRNILFTGSGTESAALALLGVVRAYQKNAHLVTTSIEHAAVSENARLLGHEGYRVTCVDAGSDGRVLAADIARAITPDTVLVSVMYANNETGAIQPIREIARVIRKERTRRRAHSNAMPLFFHTDACQAAGFLPLNTEVLGVDLMTLNASKLYGPKGVGALYVRNTVPVSAFYGGGGQERGLRSGTENVAGIVGFGKALTIAERKKTQEIKRLTKLRDYFIQKITQEIPHVVLNGPTGELRLPNNVNILVPDISGESMVLYLDVKGVVASTGSACDTSAGNASRDILHAVRFTLGRGTVRSDIEKAARAFKEVVTLLRKAPQQHVASEEKNRQSIY